MDIIKIKIQTYNDLIPHLKNHINKLSLAHTYSYEIKDSVNSHLLDINKNLDELKEKTTSKFKPLHNVNNVRDSLKNIIEEINTESDIPSNVSNTFLVDLESNLQKINIRYEVLMKTDENLTNKYVSKTLRDLDKNINSISKDFNQYPNSIELYSKYLKKMLDTSDEKTEKEVLDIIEISKYKLFEDNKNYNSSLQRFTLIPVLEELDIDALLKASIGIIRSINKGDAISGGFSPDILNPVSVLFKEHRIGLFLIETIRKKHIIFDFKNLLNRKFSEKNKTSKFYGVTRNILQKFNNIKLLGESPGNTSNTYRLGDINSNRWVIARTLTGDLFDIMGRNYNIYFDKNFINKLERGSSKLINGYQQMACRKVESFLKLPQEVLLNYSTSNIKQSDISNLAVQSLTRYIDTLLKIVPKDLQSIYRLIDNEKIESRLSEILIDAYNYTEMVDEELEPELLSTYLSNIDHIIFMFTKYIKEGISKYNFTELMFIEKTKDYLYKYIREAFINIIKEASKKAFNTQKDIYEKISVKKNLLKISLK